MGKPEIFVKIIAERITLLKSILRMVADFKGSSPIKSLS
jgi:hypothetical protein